jgi:hypothetical protein
MARRAPGREDRKGLASASEADNEEEPVFDRFDGGIMPEFEEKKESRFLLIVLSAGLQIVRQTIDILKRS